MPGGLGRNGFLLVVSGLASLLAVGSARAQQPTPAATAAADGTWTPADCPAPGPESGRRRAAGQLFAEGERASSSLQVGAAARAFACSYALVATAQAAYNAAVAYEGLGEARRARHWFQRYLEQAPDADDRAEVSQRLTALDTRVAELDAREQAARDEEARRAEADARDEEARLEAARAEAALAAAAPVAEEPQGLGPLGLTGVIAGGTGVAAVITGFVLYGVAGGVHDDFVTGGRTDGSLASRGETLDEAASSLWIVGGVIAVAGAALALMDLLELFGRGTERPPETARIAPFVAPGARDGGVLGVVGVF